MKHIITIIATIALFVATSVTANAQYAIPVQNNGVQTERPNLLQMPEYLEAQKREKAGRTNFFIGLGLQTVGTGLLFVPTATYTRNIEQGYETREATGLGVICPLIGGVFVLTGTVFEIVGLCKWIGGATTMRDLRIAYAFSGNGIVVTF